MPCASLSMVFHITVRPCWLIFRILLADYRGNRYHQGRRAAAPPHARLQGRRLAPHGLRLRTAAGAAQPGLMILSGDPFAPLVTHLRDAGRA